MARILPSSPRELRLAGASPAELETLERLAETLPGDYTIFHSVRWAEMTPARQRFGELDFVVVNQAGDLLIIEQKNGALHEGAETLEKEYAGGRKSVVWQVHRARDGVLSSLAEAGITPPTVSVLVYCPDHRLLSVSAAGLSVDAVVDATERDRLAERIQKLLGPGRADSGARAREVREFLAQALSLEPDLTRTVELHERTFQRLRSGLKEVLESLEFHPWRLRVRAPAGAGKSIAAANAFRRARERGQRVLLVCFNRPLADQLQRTLGEHQDVDSFHGLARQWTDRFSPGFDPSRAREEGQEYWNGVVDELALIAEHAGPYDTIIVDEGQDFEPEWWEILQLAMKPDFDCLWLEDRDQALYEREPVSLENFVVFRQQGNFRTPARLARYIDRLLGWRMDWRNALSGMHPTGPHLREPGGATAAAGGAGRGPLPCRVLARADRAGQSARAG